MFSSFEAPSAAAIVMDIGHETGVTLTITSMNRALEVSRLPIEDLAATYAKRANAKRAVRAYRKCMHANRQWFHEAEAFAVADAMFDAGEFGGGSATEELIDSRDGNIRSIIARRFKMTVNDLEEELLNAEIYEYERMLER